MLSQCIYTALTPIPLLYSKQGKRLREKEIQIYEQVGWKLHYSGPSLVQMVWGTIAIMLELQLSFYLMHLNGQVSICAMMIT